MYQYKAILQSSQEVIAEGHTLEDLEAQVVNFRRKQKYGEHTNMNNKIKLIHIKRDQLTGKGKEELIKLI